MALSELAKDELLYGTQADLIGLILFSIHLAVTEGMFRVGRREREKESSKPLLSLVQGALLTLLALLLAFTVSMSEVRYEARKQILVDEANAIGTTFLRASLLPDSERREMQALLNRYVDDRIAFYEAGFSERSLEEVDRTADRLQSAMWSRAAAFSKKQPTVMTSLFLQSLNETIDLKEKQVAAFENHVPDSLITLLLFFSVLVMGSVGFVNGVTTRRYFLPTSGLSLVIVLTLLVILDIDRPRRGVIKLGEQSMIRLRDGIRASP